MMRRFLICFLALCFIFSSALCEETVAPPVHPLMDKDAPLETIQTPHRFFNLLVLGIDYGGEMYRGSGKKSELSDCHTDAVMVVALDLDENKATLVSIPRDTVTYVPGASGLYKLNSAVNCAATVEEGLEVCCQAVSRTLGGIPIDAYCAVDFAAMIAIGDAIGGVDFELEMTYSHYSRKYEKGWQHLDGLGIADYLRARVIASVNKTDLGRTNRQRELMTAILQKMMAQPEAIAGLVNLLTSEDLHFFTNISTMETLALLPTIMKLDLSQMASYVLEGPYRSGPGNFNFTYTDQENRQAVIKAVWDVQAAQLPYVNKKYTDWLDETGFKGVYAINVTKELLAACGQGDTDAKKEALEAAAIALEETMDAFTLCSYTQTGADIRAYNRALANMKNAADKAAKLFDMKDYTWHPGKYWYANPMVNEYQLDWH